MKEQIYRLEDDLTKRNLEKAPLQEEMAKLKVTLAQQNVGTAELQVEIVRLKNELTKYKAEINFHERQNRRLLYMYKTQKPHNKSYTLYTNSAYADAQRPQPELDMKIIKHDYYKNKSYEYEKQLDQMDKKLHKCERELHECKIELVKYKRELNHSIRELFNSRKWEVELTRRATISMLGQHSEHPYFFSLFHSKHRLVPDFLSLTHTLATQCHK